ncbi:MAG: alpha/beta fold hydrolase [Ilumatobacteraceae bacterium]
MRGRWQHFVGSGLCAVVVVAACGPSADVTSTSASPVTTEAPAGGSSDPSTSGPPSGDPTTPEDPPSRPEVTVASTTPPNPGPVDVSAFEPAPIQWVRYDDGIDTAVLEVPVDWADPDGPRFELFLVRHKAWEPDERIGSLLVNPGGPGSEGSFLAFSAPAIYDRELLRRFDIIAWDPRGTGESQPPIDCIDDYDRYFTDVDSTPDDEAERRRLVDVAKAFADECIAKNEYLRHVGTNNSARDMDAIRRALGEETVSYFGFSYGSELGATWATLFPETVRAAVLDGAADPDADEVESGLQQYAGFEAALESFLAWCGGDRACPFHSAGDAAGEFDRLMVSLDAAPIPAGDPTRPLVNRDVATTAVIVAMYDDASWPQLARALADARDGDGAGLMRLHDSYYRRRPDGTYDNFLEAFPVISCADAAERRTVEEIDADSGRYSEVAPRLVPEGSLGGYTCTFLPPSLDPRIEITGDGAPTILVIGTTGDPSTPLDSTIRMANALDDSRLVVVVADQHTGYGVNSCVIGAVNDYLVALEPPEDGLRCG